MSTVDGCFIRSVPTVSMLLYWIYANFFYCINKVTLIQEHAGMPLFVFEWILFLDPVGVFRFQNFSNFYIKWLFDLIQ